MIRIETIRSYFPPYIRENVSFDKYIVKEYLQLMILDFLANTPYIRKLSFIGGTNLRLVSGIDRFSEDIDFDCKDLTGDQFRLMTDDIVQFLQRNGLRAEAKEKDNSRLKAFRRSLYFPELLFEMGLTGHRDERFLIKVESEDQKVQYKPVLANIKGCGFFFPIPVPPAPVLCAMKISAMLNRQKGRDFYDVIFLLSQISPDYSFLSERCGITNLDELKSAAAEMFETVDLNKKRADFEHLLFTRQNSERILHTPEFFKSL